MGIILISFALIFGAIFFLESMNVLDGVFDADNISSVYSHGYGEGSGASNIPIFFGLCGIAGALLLLNVKED